MVSVANRPLTIEDFEELPGHEGYELVDGELVERNVSWETSWLGGRLLRFLGDFAEPRGLGFVAPTDNGLILVPGRRDSLRYADVSFTSASRVPGGRPPAAGHQEGPPDLAVEVVSPNDKAGEVAAKVRLYLECGVRLVWVVYPETRIVSVHRPTGSDTTLRGDDALDGEDVVPGFRLELGQLWGEMADVPA